MKTLPKATKRNSKTINGQVWHFRTVTYRHYDVMGCSASKAITATRYSDGKSVVGSSRENLERVIAERIVNGIY